MNRKNLIGWTLVVMLSPLWIPMFFVRAAWDIADGVLCAVDREFDK